MRAGVMWSLLLVVVGKFSLAVGLPSFILQFPAIPCAVQVIISITVGLNEMAVN